MFKNEPYQLKCLNYLKLFDPGEGGGGNHSVLQTRRKTGPVH